MRVKILTSKPWTLRPKLKMAKVDGCSFRRKGDSWVHMGIKACAHLNEHFPLTEQSDGKKLRQRGEKLAEFTEKANEAIGQLLAIAPAGGVFTMTTA